MSGSFGGDNNGSVDFVCGDTSSIYTGSGYGGAGETNLDNGNNRDSSDHTSFPSLRGDKAPICYDSNRTSRPSGSKGKRNTGGPSKPLRSNDKGKKPPNPSRSKGKRNTGGPVPVSL